MPQRRKRSLPQRLTRTRILLRTALLFLLRIFSIFVQHIVSSSGFSPPLTTTHIHIFSSPLCLVQVVQGTTYPHCSLSRNDCYLRTRTCNLLLSSRNEENSGRRSILIPRQRLSAPAVRGGGHDNVDGSTVATLFRNRTDSTAGTSTALELENISLPPLQQKPNDSSVSLTLAAVYFAVMSAKCALPAALPLLLDPHTGLTFPVYASSSSSSVTTTSSSPQKAFQALFFRSTLGVAVGKLMLGPVIDSIGGVRSLQIALALLSSNLLIIASCQSFSVFALSWIGVDFVFSCCWAACLHSIQQFFPAPTSAQGGGGGIAKHEEENERKEVEENWTRPVSTLAAAARVGNALAFTIFASLLRIGTAYQMKQPWRLVFVASAVIQWLPLSRLFTLQPVMEKRTISTPTPRPSRQRERFSRALIVLRQEMQHCDFWLHAMARSALMIFISFLLFVPTLLRDVYQASPSTSALVGSGYAVGCLIAITIGSQWYSHLQNTNAKAGTLVALLGTSSLVSLAQLGHASQWWTLSISASAVTMFLWGLSCAIPFYIPSSLYALERGGSESSATLADVFDVVGFVLLAPFNAHVAGIAHSQRAAWIPSFAMTTLCSFTALVALVIVNLRTPQPQQQQ